jgi:hypothetical protein
MKKLLIGFIVGFVLGSSTIMVLADMGVLFDIYNQPFGTTSNPIYIEVVE